MVLEPAQSRSHERGLSPVSFVGTPKFPGRLGSKWACVCWRSIPEHAEVAVPRLSLFPQVEEGVGQRPPASSVAGSAGVLLAASDLQKWGDLPAMLPVLLWLGKFWLCWEGLLLLGCLTARALGGSFGADPAASSNHI